jgi:transposase
VIALASGLRVYLACGVTDMRKGMTGLAMLVQQTLAENPFGGAVFAFRGRRAGLIKLIWHDGAGLCMGLWPKLGDGWVRKAAYRGGWRPA